MFRDRRKKCRKFIQKIISAYLPRVVYIFQQ